VEMAGRFAGTGDVNSFWEHIRTGDDCIHRFSEQELRAAGVQSELHKRMA